MSAPLADIAARPGTHSMGTIQTCCFHQYYLIYILILSILMAIFQVNLG